MEFDYLRPLVIGLLATAVSAALGRALSRWLPGSSGGKSAAELLRENRRIIWAANASLLLGLATGLVMYKLMGFSENDLRPLGLAVGIALSAPMGVLRFAAIWSGKKFSEVVDGYALYQKLPPPVLYGITSFGVLALVLTLIAFARS